eukprot:CAMPEP_0205917370 /NCGR_PEP_ID=MMETSP1325-20131115/9123_1 /ASSEMBLY_ACC=CAM_ASM_000708 /TAXON_ID=236786 /ORGANISM="Florenciella sp., Strain RCC1007" /LENGTH=53 /DNA_ID=CAMNT_0053284779 /DNA_START=111 /DNA_END=272 /DNA_ORIENTATION=+
MRSAFKLVSSPILLMATEWSSAPTSAWRYTVTLSSTSDALCTVEGKFATRSST